ncbi:MAG: AMP-binding protein [Myxococcota bacterium]
MIPPERYASLGELLQDALVQFKTETAVVEYARKKKARELSYRDLAFVAARLARRFEAAGVGAGDRVAIILQNQPDYLVTLCALFLRGAIAVPLDYKLTGPELETLLGHAKPKVLVTEHASWRDLQRVQRGAVAVPLTLVLHLPPKAELPAHAERYEEALGPDDAPAPRLVPRRRSDPATIVYSSGTSGAPKGCVLTHDNYLEQYRTLTKVHPLAVGDRYFSILPTNHAIDFMCGFLGALACGATVVHQRSLRPEFIRHVMQKGGITIMTVVPLILEAFERTLRERLEERGPTAEHAVEALARLNGALTRDVPRRWLSKRLLKPLHDQLGPDLRLLICGGAFVDRDRAAFFYDLGIPVVIGYGLTEACTVLTVNDLKPFRPDSVGRVLEGVELEVRGAGPDGVGEVWVRSRTVFAGYLDDPEQTAEVLQDGWLRTGDLGRLDPSGHLHLLGRSKNMIVTAGGKNIYPEDVEGAFEGLVCEELAVAAKGFVWPAAARLGAEALLLVVRPEAGADPQALREEIQARSRRLPEHKRIAELLLTEVEFPRTASMKVKRGPLAAALREAHAAREASPLEAPANGAGMAATAP